MTEPTRAHRGWATRTRAPAFGLMAAGGLAAIIIAGQPWYRVPGIDVSFSGKDVSGGLAQVLPAVVLAGALLMLTVRTIGRRIVGVAVGLAAIGMGWTGLSGNQPGTDEVMHQVRQATLRNVGQVHTVGWNFGYAGAALLALAGALLMVLYAHRWPRRPDRFARTPAAAGGAATEAVPSISAAGGSAADATTAAASTPDADDIWKAIDGGQDPTDPDGGQDG